MKANKLLEQFKIKEIQERELKTQLKEFDKKTQVERAKIANNEQNSSIALWSMVNLNDDLKVGLIGKIERVYYGHESPEPSVHLDIFFDKGCSLTAREAHLLTFESLEKVKDIQSKITQWEKNEIDWPWIQISSKEYEKQIYGTNVTD